MKYLKRFIIFFVLLLVAIRLAAPFVIKQKVNQILNTIPDYYGSLDSVHLAVWRGGLTLHNIQITTADENMAFTIKDFGIHWRWLPLFKRRIIATLVIQSPRVRILVPKPSKAGAVLQKEITVAKTEAPKSEKPKTSRSLPDQLSSMLPFRLDRLAIYDGTLRVRDDSGEFSRQASRDKSKPVNTAQDEGGRELLIQKINLEVDNITNNLHDTGTKWAKGRLTALIQDTGEVLLTFSFNPNARQPLFDLNLQIKHLDLTQLNPVMQWQSGLDLKHGIFELYCEAASADGRFEGYVKPFIEDVKALDVSQDKKQGLGKVIKQAIVGAVAFVVKNHKENEISTKLPFSGRFDNPTIGIWEAVIEVLRNAFIKALNPQLDHSITLRSLLSKK